MDDARPGRHGAEVLEGGLRPAQQRVALGVALVFEQHVLVESLGSAELVHLH